MPPSPDQTQGAIKLDHKYMPFKRHAENPILTAHDIPYPCNTVFNAAACRFNGQYVLLLRVEDLRGHSHLTLAFSDDGYRFRVEPRPWILPSTDPRHAVYERYGIEDPRITRIGDTYYIVYTAFGPHGPRIGIGRTTDFKRFERISLATEIDNKDGVLFPRKINGEYALLDRPAGMGGRSGSIWITYSPDLIYWGRAHVLHSPRAGWGPAKLGAATPPLETEEGWLVLYHGVRAGPASRLYRVGTLLLDRDDPEKVLGYTPHFIFAPEELYERTGDVPNVVFPCGLIPEDDGTVKMYYGAADTSIGLAEASIEQIACLCTPNNHHFHAPTLPDAGA